MGASAWETCPFCHMEDVVREDYEIYLNDDGSVHIYFRAVCRKCGIKWELDRDIKCKRR